MVKSCKGAATPLQLNSTMKKEAMSKKWALLLLVLSIFDLGIHIGILRQKKEKKNGEDTDK